MKQLLILLGSFVFGFMLNAGEPKIVKITVTPAEASIYINNEFNGTGYAEFTRPKKKEVVIIRVEAPDYKTIYTKFYGTDKRSALSFKLSQDGFYRSTASSGLVNKYFTVNVDSLYFAKNGDKIDTSAAWKMLHQIILNYFDEIGSTDFYGGYLQTPWSYKNFPQSQKVLRTRVTIRDITTPLRVAFQIKVSTEVAGAKAAKHGEFEEIDRIPKEYETIIEELQTRISKESSL